MKQNLPPVSLLPRLSGTHWIGFAALTVVLALVMMRAPVVVDVGPDISYHSLLYETLRLGHAWGEALITTDGPLTAVQQPAYVSGSISIAMSWQIGGNLLLAVLFVGAAYQLPWPRRWWALGLFAAVLARDPVPGPWIAIVLLGSTLISRIGSSAALVFVLGSVLGFLALFSLGHLLLGALAVGLVLTASRPVSTKLAVASGFLATVIIAWLIIGQPLRGLWFWLQRGLPVLWNTSAMLRPPEVSFPPSIWFALCAGSLLIALGYFLLTTGRIAVSVFLAGAGLLACKAIVLQPFGLPATFFITLIVAAFVLLGRARSLIVPVLLAAISFGGLIRYEPFILSDGIGHFNRQLILNLKMVAALPELRTTLREQVKQAIAAHALPRINAVVGDATIDFIGGQPSAIILSGLHLRSRPAPLVSLIRSSAIVDLNHQAMIGPDAPDFILLRFQPPNNLAPTLVDSAAQLELYRRYEFVLEEEGLMLWKRKKNSPDVTSPTLVRSGELSFGEVLTLAPALPDTGYWLEMDLYPNLIGRVCSWIGEIAEPTILLNDDAGHALGYSILPGVTSGGFLISPFIRGEPDFLRLQTGTDLPKTSSVSVVGPAGFLLWNNHVAYRLYTIPGLNLTGNKLAPEIFERFRLFNRTPVALAYLFPIKIVPYQPDVSIAFAHPPSLVEFAVTAKDRHVRASFGIIDTAYRGKNISDGVDFAVEFLPADGTRQILYHRHLDPLSVPEDRGLQQLDVAWPANRPGRLILRTYNPPERNQAYDWSYWGNITIE